ncbi:MAG TPA: type 1 glutamine amidotransferase [Kineosporiaceae bacterium]
MSGPLIAVPGRFSASASAVRYRALVNARALLEAVARAGGEPLTVLPRSLRADPQVDPEAAVAEVRDLFRWADGVLLPGGGDLDPRRYGQAGVSEEVYGVDDAQDAFDLTVARWALDEGVPLLAVCRGAQVVNVALGGTMIQHMDQPHRHRLHQVRMWAGVAREVFGSSLAVSCHHHQRVDRLGAGLRVVGEAEDGTPEAFDRPGSSGWFLGVQWHPEDVAESVPAHQAAFDAHAAAARHRAATPRPAPAVPGPPVVLRRAFSNDSG